MEGRIYTGQWGSGYNWVAMKTEPIEVQIGNLLRQHNLKLVFAESCTGGLAGSMITDVPGSSDYFIGSITAYAYEAKEYVLGVNADLLLEYGAVSSEVALKMARGVRRFFAGEKMPLESLVGVSITGIAGPGGGMPNKPVGLVWIGISCEAGEWTWQFVWDEDRIGNKRASAIQAMKQLKLILETKV